MVTQKDIAEATGYSAYTVSSALSGRGQVAASTRAHIRRVAKKMGYRANAAAALLGSHRRRGDETVRQMKIGWISPFRTKVSLAGFERGCEELGYQGDWVNPLQFASPKAMVRVLYNRGYVGVILSDIWQEWSEDEWVDAEWDRLSVVKKARVFPRLAFHLVRHSAFDYMMFVLKEAERRGYRRLAILLVDSKSEEDDSARLGAILAFRERFALVGGELQLNQPLFANKATSLSPATVDWLRSYRPDAVIGFPYEWATQLRAAGFKIPDTVAFATPLSSVHFHEALAVSGCDPQTDLSGHRAVGLLHTLIQTGQRGFARSSLQDVIVPKWVDGGTLPPRNG